MSNVINSNTKTLISRNLQFSSNFSESELPILPKLRTVLITCADARVDPAHILGLELGDAVVIRNSGGRVTQSVLDEIATIAFMVSMMEGTNEASFEIVIMQHTQCGAERFADPNFQTMIKDKVGIDVSEIAISDHKQSIIQDVRRLQNAPGIPSSIIISGLMYDVKDGTVSAVVPPIGLNNLNLK